MGAKDCLVADTSFYYRHMKHHNMNSVNKSHTLAVAVTALTVSLFVEP